jgi:protease-4
MHALLLTLTLLTAQPLDPTAFTAVEGAGSLSVLHNPALLGFQPGSAFGVLGTAQEQRAGGVLALSHRLFGKLTPGLALGGFGERVAGSGGALVAAGLGVALGDLAALGLSGGGLVADPDLPADGVTFLTLGAALRPLSWLALGGTFMDANGPANPWVGGREYALGLGLRPMGRWLEADAGVRWRHGAPDPSFLAKLQVHLWSGLVLAPFTEVTGGQARWGGWLGVSLGGLTALGAGDVPQDGGELRARLLLSGSTRPQEPTWRPSGITRVVNLESREGQGSTAVMRVLAALRLAGRDRATGGVALRLAALDWPLSDVLEAARLLDAARLNGKSVSFFLDGGNLKTLLLARRGDALALNPGAAIEVLGLRTTGVYLKGLLDWLGLRMEVVAVGRYKNAPELATRAEPSDEARSQVEEWLAALNATVEAAWDARLGDRAGLYAKGLLHARELAPLLDGARLTPFPEWWRGLPRATDLLTLKPPEGAWGLPRRVAVVPLEGLMVGGHGGEVPFLGLGTTGTADTIQALERAFDDPSVVAVVIRANSGGGFAQSADDVVQWLESRRGEKPVYVSMTGVCASGCLYLASGADALYAAPGTLVGSIGAFAGKLDASGLLTKLGVRVEEFGRPQEGRDLFAASRPLSDAERERLRAVLEAGVAQFKERIAARGTVKDIDSLADGRVWEATEAQRLGLVDQVGGFTDVLARIEQESGGPLELSFPPPPDLLERLERLSRWLLAQQGWSLFYLAVLFSA